MPRTPVLAGLVCLLLQACAHVPKESVELSATVGRDLATVHQAHRELAQVLFGRMRSDVNRFVDDVYAPFQIRNVIVGQDSLAKSPDPAKRRASLFRAIADATEPGASPQLLSDVIQGMGKLVSRLRDDIAAMRQELLDPLVAQEEEVIGSIDRAYQQLHYANSIVTGHLSSVVKVHDAQAEVLQAIGVDRDLRTEVGASLAAAAVRIGSIVEAADGADSTLGLLQESVNQLHGAVDTLGAHLERPRKED